LDVTEIAADPLEQRLPGLGIVALMAQPRPYPITLDERRLATHNSGSPRLLGTPDLRQIAAARRAISEPMRSTENLSVAGRKQGPCEQATRGRAIYFC
jgi:hypothetical protein